MVFVCVCFFNLFIDNMLHYSVYYMLWFSCIKYHVERRTILILRNDLSYYWLMFIHK